MDLPRDSLENEGLEAPEPLLEACKNALRFREFFRDVFFLDFDQKGSPEIELTAPFYDNLGD